MLGLFMVSQKSVPGSEAKNRPEKFPATRKHKDVELSV